MRVNGEIGSGSHTGTPTNRSNGLLQLPSFSCVRMFFSVYNLYPFFSSSPHHSDPFHTHYLPFLPLFSLINILLISSTHICYSSLPPLLTISIFFFDLFYSIFLPSSPSNLLELFILPISLFLLSFYPLLLFLQFLLFYYYLFHSPFYYTFHSLASISTASPTPQPLSILFSLM